MKVLYIGGTGEISPGCIKAGLTLGQQITVFNRGRHNDQLPQGVSSIIGDMSDPASYAALGDQRWDVVCQFRAFAVEQAQRDVEVFAGKCGQFVFVSSASAYEKPQRSHIITEQTPLVNPYWQYSQRKAEVEAYLMDVHRQGKLPVTIVRPSHTIRTQFPSTFIGGDHTAWRIVRGKPIVVQGDGSSLWVITHCDDFGQAFAKLLGNAKAIGEAYHITADEANAWDRIIEAIGAELGAPAKIVHVASDTLVKRHKPEWAGPLLGDKSCSVIFDNSKVKAAVGGWSCRHSMRDAIRMAAPFVRKRLETFEPDAEADALVDRIVADHS